MYRAVKPSRAQVVRAVATCPPASTRTSRMWSFVVSCGKAGTTQIVSIAFRPRPTTSTVLFFKVALFENSGRGAADGADDSDAVSHPSHRRHPRLPSPNYPSQVWLSIRATRLY